MVPRRGLEDTSSKLFVKRLDQGVFTSTSAAEGTYASFFNMNQLGEVVSFSNIFDQYKVVSLTLHLHPINQIQLPVSSPQYSVLAIAPDYDDSTAVGFSNLLNYSSVRVLPTGKSTSMTIKPHVNIGSSGSEQNVVSPWIDFSESATNHFGFKIAVKQSSSTNVSSWWGLLEVHFLGRYVR